MTDSLTLRSRDGFELEAAFDEVEKTRGGLVVCHPHPGFGGTMDAPLLLALRDEMVGRGWSVLRFNFRGVGRSEGRSSLGEDEVGDALGAIDWITERTDAPIALAGWSFGGAVALRTAAEHPVTACAVIAPAVTAKEGISAGLPGSLVIEAPVLVVVGDNDEQVSPDACRAFAGTLPNARFTSVPGANHFFWAKYPQLCALVGDFLDEVV